jgi:hypothetical protein
VLVVTRVMNRCSTNLITSATAMISRILAGFAISQSAERATQSLLVRS